MMSALAEMSYVDDELWRTAQSFIGVLVRASEFCSLRSKFNIARGRLLLSKASHLAFFGASDRLLPHLGQRIRV